jgi:hypothetical protein
MNLCIIKHFFLQEIMKKISGEAGKAEDVRGKA